MSLWNHYTNFTDDRYKIINETPGRVGGELPRPPDDIHEFWSSWCTRGWFDWESDGWPFWSHLGTTQSWWNFRDLPNILLLHYANMKRDLTGCVGRVADFLGVSLRSERLAQVVEATSFDSMKKRGEDYVLRGGTGWKGGADTFMHMGTNGRWRGVLTAEELRLYDAAYERTLSDSCRIWTPRKTTSG